MRERTFTYTNGLGLTKQLTVDMVPNDDNKYHVTCWCLNNGEYCGSGNMTKQELNDYLAHYGINERIE